MNECLTCVSEMSGCERLAEAFGIFARYTPVQFPVVCDHEVMYVLVDPDEVSVDDLYRLDELGFEIHDDRSFESMRFGLARRGRK